MKKSFLTICVLGSLALASCSKSDNNAAPEEGNARVQMFLTDAPANYEAVYLSVKGIEINDSTGDEGWISYPINVLPSPFNILDYRNGDVYTMGEPFSFPGGKIEQIRLLLNETGNTVVVDGKMYDIEIPSSAKSGLKINFHQNLEPGGVYKIWIDYDVARSIHRTGNGRYMMKPTIKAFSEMSNGQVYGYVKPAAAMSVVHAIQGADTVATTIPATDGYYKFVGLDAGSYNISFDATDSTGYTDVVKPGVMVEFGKATNLETTTLVKP